MVVMPTTVKQTNKPKELLKIIMKKRNIAIVKKSTKKLPSDIVLKISSRNQKKILCNDVDCFLFFKNNEPLNNSCYVFPKTICQVYFCYLHSTKT